MTDLLITAIAMPDTWDANGIFEWFMHNASYILVFVLMVIESSFIPFPSEVIVPPAAYLATAHLSDTSRYSGTDMNIFVVVLVATAGAIVGALFNYYLALWIGRPAIYRFANSRIGHFFLITEPKVQKAEVYFDKHGAVSTLIGRLLPAVRQLISIPAGLARMNIYKFILYTGLGALIWNIVLAGLGYWLGLHFSPDQLHEEINIYNSYLTIGGYTLLGVCVLYLLWNALRPHKKNVKQ